jgi:hypothetical protein
MRLTPIGPNERLATVAFSLAVTVFVSLLWRVQRFIPSTFSIRTEMARGDAGLANKSPYLTK